MKERPILFSGPMVKALLAGTKTQTRRVIDPRAIKITGPNPPSLFDLHRVAGPGPGWAGAVRPDGRGSGALLCPYGQAGDRLWVRETWARGRTASVFYRAAGDEPPAAGWKSPIFMPRRFSRLTLEVMEVRVQRLQEISEEDARAEGFCCAAGHPHRSDDQYRGAFAKGWDSINSKRGYDWATNPWVWAITLRRVA